MKKSSFSFVAGCILSFQADAACNDIFCDGLITEIYLRNADSVHVRIDQDISPLNCAPLGERYITLSGTNKNADRIYSGLLTAKSTKTRVRLRIVENPANCIIDYVRIYD